MPLPAPRVSRTAVRRGALALALAGALALATAAVAEEATPEPPPATTVEDELLVTGGAAEIEKVPGSAHFVGKEELERRVYDDIHRVVAQLEGVAVQDEDGFGLRPNIGMRGTGVNRSEKITLLEDGVLAAPAPYSAPAAYYFPTVARMEAVEVRKGSSAVLQGPFTTGGVLNLVSSSIPGTFSGLARVGAGDHGTRRLHARVGDSGPVGWLLEGYRLETSGFKELDGGGDTGVELGDYLGKLRWASSRAARGHSLTVKLGRTRQRGRETYLGLTDGDFARTPLRRYAASRADVIDTDHEQRQVRYLANPAAGLVVSATLYRNDFFRNWHKLQSVAGTSLPAVLSDPLGHPGELALLRGERDDSTAALAVRNNRRDYYSEGLDARLTWRRAAGRLDHELEIGLRLHGDGEDRFQEDDRYDLVGGSMLLAERGKPGSQANRVVTAEARATYLAHRLRAGRWTVSPGVRLEAIDFERLDYGGQDPARVGSQLEARRNDARVLLPGISVSREMSSKLRLFAGGHRGFAAPGPGQDPDTEAEESFNWEAGLNFRARRWGARAVGFYNDYDNLIGRDSLAVGGDGSGETFNAGKVSVRGLELAIDAELGQTLGLAQGVPVRLGYTWTDGRFETSFNSDFADWAPTVERGDRLPYVAEHELHASCGLVAARWEAFADLSWVGAARTRPGSGPIPPAEALDERLVVDVALHLELTTGLKLVLQGRNVTDEVYLAARRPAGARPGLPRTILGGLEWRF